MSGIRVHFGRLYSGNRAICGAYPRWLDLQLVRATPARAVMTVERQAEHLAKLARVSCGTCLRSLAYRTEVLLTELADSAEARQDRGECPACGEPADLPGTETECPCHAYPVPAPKVVTA